MLLTDTLGSAHTFFSVTVSALNPSQMATVHGPKRDDVVYQLVQLQLVHLLPSQLKHTEVALHLFEKGIAVYQSSRFAVRRCCSLLVTVSHTFHDYEIQLLDKRFGSEGLGFGRALRV